MGIFSTGAGAANRAARDTVAAGQGRASNLTTLIGNTFSDPRRAQQRTSFMDALRSQLADTTSRGYTNTARQTKFATARQGLTGGRVDVDRQGRNLEDLFQRRIADEGQVQDAGNSLRMQDEALRSSLMDTAYGASNIGQGAGRGFASGIAGNAAQMGAFWPQLGYNIGNSFADAYSRRRNAGVMGAAGGY
jgi:hypothetical protein